MTALTVHWSVPTYGTFRLGYDLNKQISSGNSPQSDGGLSYTKLQCEVCSVFLLLLLQCLSHLSQQDRQNRAAASGRNLFLKWHSVMIFLSLFSSSSVSLFISRSIHMFVFGKIFGFSFPEQNCSLPRCCIIPSLHKQSYGAQEKLVCCLFHSFNQFYKYYFKGF